MIFDFASIENVLMIRCYKGIDDDAGKKNVSAFEHYVFG